MKKVKKKCLIPIGNRSAWFGKESEIPKGWKLCEDQRGGAPAMGIIIVEYVGKVKKPTDMLKVGTQSLLLKGKPMPEGWNHVRDTEEGNSVIVYVGEQKKRSPMEKALKFIDKHFKEIFNCYCFSG